MKEEFINDTNYLDQHFLTDENIINKFINSCDLNEDDIVVEIGAGKGVLSNKIVKKVKYLYIIEKDKRLKKYLDKLNDKYNNISIEYNNVLDCYIPESTKIITSLPYSIVEPFINKLIKANSKNIYMIIGNKYYTNLEKVTKLSIISKCFYKIDYLFDIDYNAFYPMPRVKSCALKLTRINEEELDYKYKILRELYYFRDMKIKNALIKIFIKIDNLTQKEAKAKVKQLEIDDILDERFISISNKNLEKLYNKLN